MCIRVAETLSGCRPHREDLSGQADSLLAKLGQGLRLVIPTLVCFPRAARST